MKQIRDLLVLHHSHTDIGYTHPQPVLWDLQRRFIDEAIELCEATADWPEESRVRWTCETTAPLLHWLERAPASRIERFRELVKAGRMGAGAMYFHGTPLLSGAELADVLEPIRRLRDELGLPLRVAINHDINGLPWTTTQLLLDAGVELQLMGINVHLGGYPMRRPMPFRWKGADGRLLLAFNGEHYNSFNQHLGLKEESTDVLAERLEVYWRRVLVAGPYPHDFLFLTSTHSYHPDNNPPSLATARVIRRWNEEGRQPVIRYVTPEMLLERIRRQEASLPVHEGDWPDFWNFGCASSARETRVSLETGARLFAVEKLLAHAGAAGPEARANLDRAWFNVRFYKEHTWGAAPSTEHPDRDGVKEQWIHKAAYAWTGRSLAGMAMRDALEEAAGNPANADGLQGILLFNPGPKPVTVCPRVPAEWLKGEWRHFSSAVQALDVARESWEDSTGVKVGPIDLPACGLRTIPVKDLAPLPDGPCQAGAGFLQSPSFRLEFDPKSGRILSLKNRKTGRELADAGSRWPFFGFVTESVDPAAHASAGPHGGRDAFYTFDWELLHADAAHWHTDWPVRRAAAGRLRSLRTECDGEGAALILQWEDESSFLDLEQRVALPAHRPVVELFVSYRKPDLRTTDSNYLVFPLALDAWEGWYDTGDLPVRFDGEEIPGACRDYITVGSYAALADAVQAVTLACPDAPMVQFGDFYFGRKLASVPKNPRPLLLAWMNNNYWNTNFRVSQPGALKFRFELSASERFDAFEAALAGASARAVTEVHPVAGDCRDAVETCVSVEGAGIVLLQAKPRDRGEVLVRVVNAGDQPSSGRLGLSSPLQSAALCTTLGEPGESLKIGEGKAVFELPGRRLATLILRR